MRLLTAAPMQQGQGMHGGSFSRADTRHAGELLLSEPDADGHVTLDLSVR